jgi:two-component system sensor histidine kinase/response regulator
MKKVLVIDDTAEVRELVQTVLDSSDFETIAAADGASGIAMARQHLPSLILCDVNMPPGMDGYGVLKEIRSDPATATIPFVFLSGAADKSNMRQGMELGADDYLTKPFTLGELLAAVNSRIKKQETVQQLTEKRLGDLRQNISLALPHELLTPLHGILGLSALMIEDHQTMKPAEVLEYARNIQDAGQRLNRLIENFLTYSRIELVAADPAKIEAFRRGGSVAARATIEEIATRTAHKHGRGSDSLVQVGDALLPLVPEHFSKIVEELLDNAFKFSKLGTPVRLLGLARDGKYVLTLGDRGRGLTPEQIQRIGAHMQFDREYYEQQGSGLGLIIAKRLAELYGGSLTVQSAVGQSTTVTVTLPVA